MSRLALACLLAAACLAPRAARAQQRQASPPAPEPRLDSASAALLLAEYRADLAGLRESLVSLAGAIPAERFSWRPSPAVRTVSEVLMHVAGEWFYICPLSVGAAAPPDFTPPREAMRKLEQVTAKADVLAQLEKAWAHCSAALGAADPARLLGRYEPARMSLARASLRVSGDQHEHLGQLVAYARSVGVKPPWSQ